MLAPRRHVRSRTGCQSTCSTRVSLDVNSKADSHEGSGYFRDMCARISPWTPSQPSFQHRHTRAPCAVASGRVALTLVAGWPPHSMHRCRLPTATIPPEPTSRSAAPARGEADEVQPAPGTPVGQPVVHPAGLALPELDQSRASPGSRPSGPGTAPPPRRTGPRRPRTRGQVRRGDHTRLGGRPGAELRTPRPAGEVGLGLLPGDGAAVPSIRTCRCTAYQPKCSADRRVVGDLDALARVVVGEEGEAVGRPPLSSTVRALGRSAAGGHHHRGRLGQQARSRAAKASASQARTAPTDRRGRRSRADAHRGSPSARPRDRAQSGKPVTIGHRDHADHPRATSCPATAASAAGRPRSGPTR